MATKHLGTPAVRDEDLARVAKVDQATSDIPPENVTNLVSWLSGSVTPATHTHTAAQVVSGALAIGRIPTGTSSSTVCVGNDSRLSDARPPTAHTHAASDINSGTVGIARIPTGTTSSTVCIGNDSRLSNARTPTAHTHTVSDVTDLQSDLDAKVNTADTALVVQITQAAYNALGAGRPAKLYAIVG